MREKYFELIQEGKIDEIKALKATGQIYGSEIDVDGYSAMHEAAKYGHLHIMQWLLIVTSLTLNEQSAGGNTPLHVAAEYEQLLAIEWLISHGADPTRTNNMGQTYLDVSN